MKKHKISYFLLSLLLAFSFAGCTSKSNDQIADQSKEFDEFIQQEFVETLENDYLSSHIILENPENFGIDTTKIKVGFGLSKSDSDLKEAQKTNDKTLKAFKKFDRNALKATQQDTYDIYEYMLNTAVATTSKENLYLEPAFETMTGMHSQLPTLFTDWKLTNQQDVVNLITMVKDTDRYIQGLLDYTKKQEEKGTLMINIDDVVSYCQKIVDNKDASPILTSLNTKINALNISDDQKKSDQEELSQAFHDSFIKAYQNIVDTLKTIDQSKIKENLAAIDNGKEYFEILLQDSIGSNKSVKTVKDEVSEALQTCITKIQQIVSANPSLANQLTNNFSDLTTQYTAYDVMLKDLETDITADFPSVKDFNYTIENIDPSIATSGIAAYFNIPALDSSIPDEIHVNSNNNEIKLNAIDTFETVSHEGLPGHMYQINYAYQNLDTPFRKALAQSIAYQEGWATYVQMYATKYLDNVNPTILELHQYANLYSYYSVILCDIGIHYEGWDFDKFASFYGASNEDDALKAQYVQLRDNPCTFEPYYYGYLEFNKLKDKAKSKLGDKFNDMDFHEALLKSGSAPFSVVERNVNTYIEKNS